MLHARVLTFNEANRDYALIAAYSVLLYVPLVMVVMNKIEAYKFLRFSISSILVILIIDSVLSSVLTFKVISRGLYLILISSFEKALLTSLTLSLYIFGIRLVPLANRTKMVILYYGTCTVGSLLGSIFGSFLTLLQL